MRQPNTLEKGAFFGVLSICLMLVLTVMAMNAVGQRPHVTHHDLRAAETPRGGAPDRAS